MSVRNLSVGGLTYAIITAEAAAAEVAGEGAFGTNNLAESLGLTEGYAEMGDFIYSATAEGRTGEVADAASAIDVDDEPGLIYTGPSGRVFNLSFTNVDISEGTIAPEATDTATIAVLVNNKIVGLADEGYAALTGEATHEMNLEAGVMVPLTTLDVVRLVLIGDGTETNDVDIAVAGGLVISG